jgi:hypothetical protein
MSSRQSGLLAQDRHGTLNIGDNSTDDVRLPYTQLPPDRRPNQAKYPPRHSGHWVPPITSLAHGIPLNHDPEQARRLPPNPSESSVQKRTLSKSKPEQTHPSKVRECFIDDDRDGCLTVHAATEAI